MGEWRKRIWIELTPVETFFSVAIVMILLGVSFGIGMHYGENLIAERPASTELTEKAAMAEIEQYLKNHKSSFRFQKALDSNDPNSKQYLYVLDVPEEKTEKWKEFTRTLPHAPVTPPPSEEEAHAENAVDTPLVEVPVFSTEGHEAPEVVDDSELAARAAQVVAAALPQLEEKSAVPAGEVPSPKASPVIATAATPVASPPSVSFSAPPPESQTLPLMRAIEAEHAEKYAARQSGYVVQAETFDTEERAQKRQSELQQKGYKTFIDVQSTNASLPYRIYVGPYSTKEEAKSVLDGVRASTRPDAFVRYYEAKEN